MSLRLRLRNWLLLKLAGSDAVAINLEFLGTVGFMGNLDNGLVANCSFVSSGKGPTISENVVLYDPGPHNLLQSS